MNIRNGYLIYMEQLVIDSVAMAQTYNRNRHIYTSSIGYCKASIWCRAAGKPNNYKCSSLYDIQIENNIVCSYHSNSKAISPALYGAASP